MIQTVGMVGMGALGGLYGKEMLKTLPKEAIVGIMDEARAARFAQKPLRVNGEEIAFCTATPKEAKPVDLLIFMVKYPQLAEAIQLAGPFIDEHTIILSFLNGVSSEGLIEEGLGTGHLLYACVQGMDATKDGQEITYSKVGYIAFGEKDNSKSPAVEELAAFFDKVGLAYQVPADIHHQIWKKWMLNVGVNQTCACFDVDYGGVQTPGPLREKMRLAMTEAYVTANAEGIALTKEELEAWIGVLDGLAPEGKPSMRQDVLANRETEVELFAGVVCALGEKYGIDVPVNREFYEMLKK